MDAQQALSDLTEISSQIRAAVVFDDKGNVAGSTLEDSARAEELARSAGELLAIADGVKSGDGAEVSQLEAATEEGSVFVVREGPTRIAATTGVDPTVGLVFYDLKSALRNLETKPAAKRPVRASAPGEGVSGEPGGSPAAKQGAARKPATAKKPPAKKPAAATTKKPDTAAAKKPASTARKPAARKKKDDAS
jgi:predicted regulator of Ras-like GTPase activity (Roadblock/LC7/MglB family)